MKRHEFSKQMSHRFKEMAILDGRSTRKMKIGKRLKAGKFRLYSVPIDEKGEVLSLLNDVDVNTPFQYPLLKRFN